MKVEDITFDPNNLDPEHDFVFRDFERSKILLIRSILEKDRGFISLVYLAIVVFWTTMMSYGASIHGDGRLAINLAPHLAHYTLIIGVMLYPIRRLWIPLAAFSLVYFIPFAMPDASGHTWFSLGVLRPQLIVLAFLAHVVSGVMIGGLAIFVMQKLRSVAPPHSVDLYTAIAMGLGFLAFWAALVGLFWNYAHSLPEASRALLGYGPDYVHSSVERVLRGAVLAEGLFLAILEVPSRKVFLKSLMIAPIFPLLAWAQSHGFGMYAAMDASVLALILVSTLPIAVAIGTCIVGVPVYSAMTGVFVTNGHFQSPAQDMMEHYSLIILITVMVIAMLRSFVQLASRQRQGTARRLSKVRDFADVGLLSFNLDRLRFRADVSTQRLLGTKAAGSAAEFETLFQSGDGADLGRVLRTGQQGSVDLVLTRQHIGAEQQVLRMCLWYETAQSGEQVAYGLVLDVTAEHRQERALKETLAELSSRQERQRQLFSIISHELRTPASVVSMLVEDLEDHQIAAPVRKQLRDATDQLLSTLADMRQTVNPSQNLPINRIPYAAAELAESVRNMFAPQAKDNGMTIRLSLGDASRVLRIGDQMRVRQAISNVVRNAIIHSKGSEVVIRFEGVDSPDGLISRWTITDNGIGIPSTEVARLFKPFERGTQDPRSHADGSGLGLFIAKSSVEMLGGTIVHFDPTPGGTGYRVELPEPKVTDGPPAVAPEPTAFETARFPSLYVLLAEDNALVAEVTLAKLSRFVGRVDVVSNGYEALDKIAERCPDLLITDLFMPEMDGDDLIRRLRSRQSNLPIIGLTAAVVGDDIERLRQAGADQVMAKPLDMRALRKFIFDLTASPQKNRGVA